MKNFNSLLFTLAQNSNCFKKLLFSYLIHFERFVKIKKEKHTNILRKIKFILRSPFIQIKFIK
jgi:hypothetical protein